MFHLLFSLPWLYVATRSIWPLPWPEAARIAMSLALLVASQYHLWSRLSSGSVFAPEFPRAVVILFNWAFGAIVLLAVFQIALDLASLVATAARPGWIGMPAEARYAAGAAAFALAGIGVALQLSGHTHGGMIIGLDRIVARANGGFVSGRYRVDAMTLYVGNGTGIWPGFALRLGRPAELTRFTLRKERG